MNLGIRGGVLVLACVSVWPGTLAAQTLYRCGNQYSQTPCAGDAKPARVPTGAAPDAAPGLHGKELCAVEAPKRLGFADADSVQISLVERGKAEVIQYADRPLAAHQYIVTLRAKNAYGTYGDVQTYRCFVSEDEHRVLKVESVRR